MRGEGGGQGKGSRVGFVKSNTSVNGDARLQWRYLPGGQGGGGEGAEPDLRNVKERRLGCQSPFRNVYENDVGNMSINHWVFFSILSDIVSR